MRLTIDQVTTEKRKIDYNRFRDVWRAFLIFFDPLQGEVWGGVKGGVKKGGVGPPPKMGVEIRGFFGGQKMVKNGQKRCGTEG